MNNFELYNPTYFAFGRGTQKKTGELVRRFGGTKALLHYGGGSVVRSGLLAEVEKSLDEAGVAYVTLGGVKPNPRSGLVYEGIELCRREGVDFVVGIGGGSAIDSGKAIAAGATFDGDFWDVWSGKAPYQTALPHGCVLTLPATGSEGSNSCVITNERLGLKRGTRSDLNRPRFAVMNPETTFTLPAWQTACGIADIMAHTIERYFTNTQDVEVSDRLCEGVLKTVIENGPVCLAQPDNYEARAAVMWAGTLAHNGQLGVGREEDWSSHAMGHELSALYDSTHGATLAMIMPQWLRYTLPGHEMRLAQFAVRVWGCEMNFERPERTALEGIARLAAFWKSLGLPQTFAELGAKEEDIPELVRKCKCDAQGNLGFFKPLSKQDVENIYRMCL